MFSTVNKQAVVIPNLRLFSNWFVEGQKTRFIICLIRL